MDITLTKLKKNFGERVVYSDLNLTLKENKVNCILGASGCGKTTLLNVLGGLTDFSGVISGLPDKVSYIFQNVRLIENLTVFQNVEYVLLGCEEIAKRKKIVLKMLELTELEDRKNSYPKELSGGMRRRVAIARAFAYPSGLVLMDEPFSALDVGLKLRQMRVIGDLLSESRRTVAFVTHDMDEAALFADYVTVLSPHGAVSDSFSIDLPVGERTLKSSVVSAARERCFRGLVPQ